MATGVLSYEVVLLECSEPSPLANEHWFYPDLPEPIKPETLDGKRLLCHLAYSVGAGRANAECDRNLLRRINARKGVRRVVLMRSTIVYGEDA